MAYVAVKGGSAAIEASLERLRFERLKTGKTLDVEDARAGLRALIDQVMSEASLYSEEVAAYAVKQAEGSPEEAVFLLRAFRSTIPRLHYTREISPEDLFVERRLSAAFKDIPGGQLLGATTDYTHRLIDFSLGSEAPETVKLWLEAFLSRASLAAEGLSGPSADGTYPKVIGYLRAQGLLADCPVNLEPPSDITKKSLEFPSKRSERLQILTRGQTGAVTALGYASLRGYGALHPTVGELRVGRLPLTVPPAWGEASETGEDDYYVGEIRITEVESLVPVERALGQGLSDLEFEIGYGICYGQNETKAVAMSLLDQILESGADGPLGDEEFILLHIDSVEATGFISHLKLPHYVTFQSKLESVRETRRKK